VASAVSTRFAPNEIPTAPFVAIRPIDQVPPCRMGSISSAESVLATRMTVAASASRNPLELGAATVTLEPAVAETA
jgi:hypothetical protein